MEPTEENIRVWDEIHQRREREFESLPERVAERLPNLRKRSVCHLGCGTGGQTLQLVELGAFLTGGIGPWAPFQMIAAGWVGFGAGALPRASGRPERIMLAGYGLVAGLLFGLVMNLWFWPFITSGVPTGMAFVPGDPVTANLSHYATFYLGTSLGWDLPRGILTAVLVMVAGRPVLASLRRGTRRAAFGVTGQFVADDGDSGEQGCVPNRDIHSIPL